MKYVALLKAIKNKFWKISRHSWIYEFLFVLLIYSKHSIVFLNKWRVFFQSDHLPCLFKSHCLFSQIRDHIYSYNSADNTDFSFSVLRWEDSRLSGHNRFEFEAKNLSSVPASYPRITSLQFFSRLFSTSYQLKSAKMSTSQSV